MSVATELKYFESAPKYFFPSTMRHPVELKLRKTPAKNYYAAERFPIRKETQQEWQVY